VSECVIVGFGLGFANDLKGVRRAGCALYGLKDCFGLLMAVVDEKLDRV